eukprot:GHVU01011585.1.p1 GENE.GHVU01011585.1~~GHVU01011585.1.p1  ORF type:complete len:164 (-),score=8.33 GHVU01011585.1:211-669(-)
MVAAPWGTHARSKHTHTIHTHTIHTHPPMRARILSLTHSLTHSYTLTHAIHGHTHTPAGVHNGVYARARAEARTYASARLHVRIPARMHPAACTGQTLFTRVATGKEVRDDRLTGEGTVLPLTGTDTPPSEEGSPTPVARSLTHSLTHSSLL